MTKAKRAVKTDEQTSAGALFARSMTATINKKFKEEGLVRQVNTTDPAANRVSAWVKSGIVTVDYLISGGKGLPVGRAIQIWGKEQCGKSAMAHYMAAQWQKSTGGVVLFLDYEGSVDEDHCEGYGWDWDLVVYSFPESMEQGWDIIWEWQKGIEDQMNAGEDPPPTLVIWDSVASAPTAEEAEKGATGVSVASQARVMSRACRKLRRRITKFPWSIIFTNQLRDKIGGFGFGDQSVRPCGKALDFCCDTRLKFTRVKTVKRGSGSDAVVEGYRIQVVNDKSRFTPPHQKAEWMLSFINPCKGPDPARTCFDALKELKVLTTAGKKVVTDAGVIEDIGRIGKFRVAYKEHRDALDRAVIAGMDKRNNKGIDEPV